jgi:predicted nucleic acid-binding protein
VLPSTLQDRPTAGLPDANARRVPKDLQAPALAAGTLEEYHGLRGYDAVHLATALSVADPATSLTQTITLG